MGVEKIWDRAVGIDTYETGSKAPEQRLRTLAAEGCIPGTQASGACPKAAQCDGMVKKALGLHCQMAHFQSAGRGLGRIETALRHLHMGRIQPLVKRKHLRLLALHESHARLCQGGTTTSYHSMRVLGVALLLPDAARTLDSLPIKGTIDC